MNCSRAIADHVEKEEIHVTPDLFRFDGEVRVAVNLDLVEVIAQRDASGESERMVRRDCKQWDDAYDVRGVR